MNRNETIQSDFPIEFAKCFSNAGFGADVVTRREKVRSIQTNAEALRFTDVVDDVREMLDAMTDA